MANDNTARDTDRAWDLMKKIGFAMLVTSDGDKLRARPMSAYLERENNARNPNVNLSFADAGDQEYASVTGTRPEIGDNRKVAMLMGIDPQEDPPIKPGQPTEPPQESPPGNPQPDVPPPMREPGGPPRPEELPGQTPEEVPVRGPAGPAAPNPAVADLPGSQPDVNSGASDLPQGTM